MLTQQLRAAVALVMFATRSYSELILDMLHYWDFVPELHCTCSDAISRTELLIFTHFLSLPRRPSPYPASFNLSLSSEDFNYDEEAVPDFNVTLEDNDEGV